MKLTVPALCNSCKLCSGNKRYERCTNPTDRSLWQFLKLREVARDNGAITPWCPYHWMSDEDYELEPLKRALFNEPI